MKNPQVDRVSNGYPQPPARTSRENLADLQQILLLVAELNGISLSAAKRK